MYYCQLHNKSLDVDGINEIPNKSIKVLLYKHSLSMKVYDFIEILNLKIYTWIYFQYCYLSLSINLFPYSHFAIDC